MKQLPSDPFAFQARVMAALIEDIWGGKGTPRLDALREVSRLSRDVGEDRNSPPSSK